MKKTYVIHGREISDNNSFIIGVASTPENALLICKAYFGSDFIEETFHKDFKEFDVEWTKIWNCKGLFEEEDYLYAITLEYFTIDEIRS